MEIVSNESGTDMDYWGAKRHEKQREDMDLTSRKPCTNLGDN